MATKIEWTDETWNPVTGCSKVSPGCAHCYAEEVARRFWGSREFADVRIHGVRLRQPLHWRKPRRVFVNSMSDLFHADVPDWFIDRVFATMAVCPQHTFQILTKRPERMRDYLLGFGTAESPIAANFLRLAKWTTSRNEISRPRHLCHAEAARLFHAWPLRNCWPGVSVEDQRRAEERIPPLLECPAAVRFVSAEPLLGALDLSVWMPCRRGDPYDCFPMHESQRCCECSLGRPGIDWVIAGGESGPGARPMHPAWVRSIRDQCAAAAVPFFFKQWGEWKPVSSASYATADGMADGTNRVSMLADGRMVLKDRGPAEKPLILDKAADHDLRREWRRAEKLPDGVEYENRLGYQWMARVGKKRAGRLLDGEEWSEFPDAVHHAQ